MCAYAISPSGPYADNSLRRSVLRTVLPLVAGSWQKLGIRVWCLLGFRSSSWKLIKYHHVAVQLIFALPVRGECLLPLSAGGTFDGYTLYHHLVIRLFLNYDDLTGNPPTASCLPELIVNYCHNLARTRICICYWCQSNYVGSRGIVNTQIEDTVPCNEGLAVSNFAGSDECLHLRVL